MRTWPVFQLALTCLMGLLCGCRSAAPQAVQLDDISPVRVSRQKQAAAEFEADRGEAEYQAALNYWDQGELAPCEERLRGVLARQPDHAPSALLLAELKLMTSEPQCAEQVLLDLVDAHPNDEELHLAAAMLALRHNRPQGTVELLKAAQSDQPASAARLRTLGLAYYRCGDYAAAQSALEQALALDNTSALAYFLVGCIQSRSGQRSAADTAFEQAARLDARFKAVR